MINHWMSFTASTHAHDFAEFFYHDTFNKHPQWIVCICLYMYWASAKWQMTLTLHRVCANCMSLIVSMVLLRAHVDVPNSYEKACSKSSLLECSPTIAPQRPVFDSRPGYVSLGYSSRGWRWPWSSLSLALYSIWWALSYREYVSKEWRIKALITNGMIETETWRNMSVKHNSPRMIEKLIILKI